MASTKIRIAPLRRYMTVALSILAGICLATPSPASSKKVYLKIGGTLSIQPMNARIRLFKNTSAQPASPPTCVKLTKSWNGNKTVFDAYPPQDLWVRDNMLGEWRSDLCEVKMFELKLPIPTKLDTIKVGGGQGKNAREFVTSSTYEKWKSGALQEKTEWTDDTISKWLSYATGLQVGATPTSLKKGASTKAVVKRFPLEDTGNGNDRLYIAASTYVPGKWYAIWYHVVGGNKDKNDKSLDASIASLAFSTPSRVKKTVSKERVLTKGGSTSTAERSEKYKENRERVINAIKSMKNWWYFETTNFILAADIKNKRTARDLADALERCRSVFEKFYPPAKPFDAACVAKMFQTRDEYLAYVGEDLKWTGGVWMSSKKELVVSPMDWGTRSDRRKMMMKTTNHESFHMYIHFACGERETAVWFNEGNATFFEGLEFRGKNAHINATYRLEKMREIAPHADIKQLLDMSYETFYGTNKDENYALGWGLIFFLRKGAPVMKEKNSYSEIPGKYYQAMLDCKNGKKATKIAWEGVDVDKFERDFRKFWSSNSLIRKAERYNAIPNIPQKGK